MRKQKWLRYIPYGIAAFSLAVASFYDVPINLRLYDPQNLFGIFFERFALFPIIMVLPITCFAYYRLHKQRMALVCYGLCSCYVVLDLLHFWMPLSQALFKGLLASMVFMFLLYVVLRKVPITFWKNHERFLLFMSLTLVTAILVTFGLKQCWGRVRFREMYPDVSQFTSWYLPQGVNGHHSFPSGHTTAISVLLCTLEYDKARGIKKQAGIVHYIGVYTIIFMMMLSRMIMGAHFLSDVTMGFTITYTVYLLYRMRFFREDFLI